MLSSGVWWSRVSCASLGNLDGVAPDSIAARVLLGNPDGVDPDSLAHSVSSERGVPTPCTRRRAPLCDAQHNSFHPDGNSHSFHPDVSHPEFCPANILPYPDVSPPQFYSADIPPSPDISQPDGRGGRFNFSGQTCPDPLIVLTRRVFLSVYSAAVFS